ncbi:MAG: ATP-dependent helicase HrpA [Actinomycetota bacterium]|nr:ATP-dependent helicase HrpA [Actinomycetota bacterium]
MGRSGKGGAKAAGAEVPVPSVAALRDLLGDLTVRDAHRLGRRIDGARAARRPEVTSAALVEVAAEIDRLRGRVAARRAAVPVVRYPEELPVSARRDDLAAAVRDHQVVIVAGETGSGKTTQLPKICLELGRGARGMIGHTQPRRIAARAVAERIAEELGVPLGELVGYQVRFTDRVSDGTQVKVMTDGVLLAEIQRDRLLTRYDTIIVDEAHERSLNIDFLLGYLHQLLPRRPDLKLIITSATIDPHRFAAHFGGAPVVEVSGRTYPVETRYRPLLEEYEPGDDGPADGETEVRDQVQAICDAVRELTLEGPGDILVFLSGEREIRDAADALTRLELRHTEIVPLFARLSAAEQHRVFSPHTGRRIVLATNVAETSLTVPGIRYVVDPGTARISRYSTRLKVQRLPIEPISQASANQRAGRCGRLEAGVCIRLYSQEDFETRPAFTDPEILRTNLASVILQMSALGLGDVGAFGFIDPPDRRAVRDGVDLLHELGALDVRQPDPRKRLTPLGRSLAQLPVDPRLGRMVLEADRSGCTHEVMIIAAALSIADPRERPLEHQQAADEAHRRFADPRSDFLAYLNLWDHLREQRDELSSSAFRRMCKREFLNYLRLREWQDLVAQLRQIAKSLGVAVSAPLDRDDAAASRIHTSLLAGMLSHIGLLATDGREYAGARGARFVLWPGSALAKKPPRWVMAAELVETSRLWGRVAARVEPEWVEALAGHLVKRTYAEPHWSRKRGSVVASEKVTLYGVPLVAGRTVQYGRIDPVLSRELFIRHALVEGDWDTRHEFFHANRALLEDVEDLENRARRRGLLVDDETLVAFYEQRIPDDVVSGRHFDSWWKQARRTEPERLTFTPDLLVADGSGVDYARDFPDTWQTGGPSGGLSLRLSYTFEPGMPDDGVTVSVPLPVLARLSPDGFEWLVPGLRAELVTALVRSLPKQIRRSLVPAPDHARAVLPALAAAHERGESLLSALSRELGAQAGVVIPRDAWDLRRLPPHLRVTFRVIDERGRQLGSGEDLDELKRDLAPRIRASVAAATGPGLERTGLRTWPTDLPGGALPRTVTRTALEGSATGQTVQGHPALVDAGTAVDLRVLPTAAEAAAATPLGVRRLLRLEVPSPARAVLARLDTTTKLTLASAPHAGASALFDDCLTCAIDALLETAGGPPADESGYRALRDLVSRRLESEVSDVVQVVAAVLAEAAGVERGLRDAGTLSVLPSLTDVREHLGSLVYPGFVTATGRTRLPDLVRYLKAARHRLEVLPDHPRRDTDRMGRVHAVRDEYLHELAQLPPGGRVPVALAEIRWMVEELRVSFFAQQIRTAYSVSEKRILKALDAAVMND